MLREFYERASADLGDGLPFVIALAFSTLGYFLKGVLKKGDASREDIARIFKDLGLLEAAKDRAREKDEEQQRLIQELQKTQQDSRERIIILEHEVKK